LQAFEFNWKTGAMRAADLARELFGVELQGAPIAWAQPFLKDIAVSGGSVHGGLVAGARGGGVGRRAAGDRPTASRRGRRARG